MTPSPADLAARLRAVGCVAAEDEAGMILASGVDPDGAVQARSEGVPLQQVLGYADFAGVRVELGRDVFVPRPRAELIVEVALSIGGTVVVDLGCGVGALAAALAERLPESEVHACDVDPAALEWARRNGDRFGFIVHEGDWWSALPAALQGEIDLAVAYLPHVPTARLGEIHPDFREHEPALSVDGGADGLDPLRAVLPASGEWLGPGGSFVTLLVEEQLEAAAGIAAFDVLRHDEGDVAVRFRA